MTGALYGVYGCSGHGREVMPIARLQLAALGVSADRLVFVDDRPEAPIVNGHRVLSFTEFVSEPAESHRATLAIGSGKVREKLAARLDESGVLPWTVRAPNAVVLDEVDLGEGAILSPFSLLTSNITIGRHFHANMHSYVAHDCVIGEFVTFAPSVRCNGNVSVEDHAYIGAGAVIKQGRPGAPRVIGRGAVVGMGAVVTKDVPAGVTVVGNPARPMVTR